MIWDCGPGMMLERRWNNKFSNQWKININVFNFSNLPDERFFVRVPRFCWPGENAEGTLSRFRRFNELVSQTLDEYITIAYRIIVAGKSKVSGSPVFSGMRTVMHEIGYILHITVQYNGSVQFNLDR